ncbi:MAG: polynucleotide adenylyltransferase PcnB [Planctomycetota bacterium]|jgi:poly(A) polymerase|nr:polynucleotide adenylyltransferase PcnB [Planctomycetota bacterium]
MSDQPIVRARHEHTVSRRQIIAEALHVLYRLKDHGYTAYLVGGGVRDLLLQRSPKDFDIGTNATPQEIRRLFNNCVLIGRRFRLAHILFGGTVIETSTFRRPPSHDPATPDLLQTEDNEFGAPAEDAFRRDFTINGLFYNIEDFSVIDYVGGLADLDARIVRAIGDPEVRFREDPVRMLRAIRFASRLDFAIEDETMAALSRCRREILKASKPRLVEEIFRLFKFNAGERAVRLLWQTGMLEDILPEIATYLRASPDPENALLWRYLHFSAEQNGEEWEEIIVALFFPLILDRYQTTPSRISCHDLQVGIHEVITPFMDRVGVPRRVRDLVRLIITTQYRFYARGKRKNFSRSRFAAQAWFPATLKLFTINTSIFTDAAAEDLDKWQDLMRREGSDVRARELARATGNPRRRRRGGKRHHRREERAPAPEALPRSIEEAAEEN